MKVINTEEIDEDSTEDNQILLLDKLEVTYGDESTSYTVMEDEPEDMTFGRSLQDCASIIKMIKMAYEAGKNGHELTVEQKVVKY